MKKLCCVLWVGLALIGSTSRGFGETPPSLTQSTQPPSVGTTAEAMKPGLLAGATRVAQAVAVATPPSREARRLDWGKLERKLAVLYPNSKVYLIPMGFKIIVRGQAHDSEEAAHILKVVHGEVVNQIAASAEHLAYLNRSFGSSGDGRAFKSSEWARGLIINELRIPGPKQIGLQVRLVELADTSKTPELLTALLGDSVTRAGLRQGTGSASGVFETNEIRSLVECLCKSGQAKVVSEPKMTVLSGRECQFLSGGELAVPPGNPSNPSREVSYIPFGTSIHACPTVNGDFISLSVQAAHTRQEDAVQQVSHPGSSSRRVTTTIEMRPGQTFVLAGFKTPQSRPTPASKSEGKVTEVGSLVDDLAKPSSDDAELLIFITPEIVTPLEPREVPPVPGFEVTRPTGLPPAPVPSRE